MSPRVSVVIPVYNNELCLDELIARTLATFEASEIDGELVLVDDGSRDGSWKLIRSAAEHDPRVVGVRLSRNFGQHPAIAAGFSTARGDQVVLMDADLQDRPEEIPRLLEQLDEGADVVFTTWLAPEGAVKERMSSRLFHHVFSRLAGLDLPRNMGTYRAMTRDYVTAVLDYPERSAVYGPLMAQMGYEQSWVEVERSESATGSGYSFRKRFTLAMNSIVSYADLPYRLFIWGGTALMLATFGYIAVVLGQYFLGSKELPGGFTLLLISQLLLSSVILLGLGVIGGYVHRVFREVLARPRYHIARTVRTGTDP